MRQFSSLLLAQLVWIFRSSASLVVERVTIPAPIAVKPSETFDGTDGLFSSFNISIGTPPQSVKVFISTSIWQTLVVVPDGCRSKPSNCSSLRGGEYLWDNSSTWQRNTANNATNVYPLLIDPQLGYKGKGALGFDVVSLAGSPGATLLNQTVAGFASMDSYLGLLGIDPRASNFTGDSMGPKPSYLQNLFSESMIPSLSWGYTAGNQYRSSTPFGSLTLGGYDQSKFVQHDGSWPIDATNNLNLQVQGITWTTSGDQGGLLANSFTATIDSSLPYLWLPKDVCLLFENAFGLQWDDASQLYLVDDVTHTTLKQRNASVVFNLGGMTGGTSTNVNITLPYVAFDLTAIPMVGNPMRYYPLKRAGNPSQIVLGRTLFQEAFVVADYERRNFSVFPCKWKDNTTPEIVSIISPTYNITSTTGPQPSETATPHKSGKSKAGPIAGGVIAGLAAIAIIAGLVWFFWWRPKRREHYTTDGEMKPRGLAQPFTDDRPHPSQPELDATQRHSQIPELEGSAGGAFEMPAKEEVASEMRANIDAQELATPETMTSEPQGGFPWRRSVPTDGGQSPSPLSSPGLDGTFSPMSSPSPGLPSPVQSPSSMRPVSLPSPVPSPPPVMHPQPQRVVRPDLKNVDSSIS